MPKPYSTLAPLAVLAAVLVLAAPPGGAGAMTPFVPTPAQQAREAALGRSAREAETLSARSDLPGARQAADRTLRLLARGGPRPALAPMIVNDLAPIYFRCGQYKRVALLYRLYPVREASLNAAIAFFESGQPVQARRRYRERQFLVRHQEFKPYLPATATPEGFEATLFLWRGIVDVDENRPADAAWALRRALRLLPNNPLALWYYGEALANSGRPAESRRSLQAALARDHGLVARRAAARLHTIQ